MPRFASPHAPQSPGDGPQAVTSAGQRVCRIIEGHRFESVGLVLKLAARLDHELGQDGLFRRNTLELIAFRIETPKAFALAHPERSLTSRQAEQLRTDLRQLAAGRPPAYILGTHPFLDWEFIIDERALIPRPETEDLCRLVLERYQTRPEPARILDLCCGSGVLGLSLALSFPHARVLVTDLCPEALALCGENIRRFRLASRVTSARGDLWAAVPAGERFDLIVANPPYVAQTDQVQDQVLDFEPHQALFSGDGGSAHIKAILKALPTHLAPGGLAAFELGHHHRRTLAPFLRRLPDPTFFRWQSDLFHIPRFLFCDQLAQPRKENT